jgi:hypothetical protein
MTFSGLILDTIKRHTSMNETLIQAHDQVVEGVRSILGISLVDLIRSVLSIEADKFNRLGLTLKVRPEWCGNPTTQEYLLPKLKMLPYCRDVCVDENELWGDTLIQLQFTIPLNSNNFPTVD